MLLDGRAPVQLLGVYDLGRSLDWTLRRGVESSLGESVPGSCTHICVPWCVPCRVCAGLPHTHVCTRVRIDGLEN